MSFFLDSICRFEFVLAFFMHFWVIFWSFFCHLFVMFLSFGLSFVGHFLVFYVINCTSCFRTGFACLSKVSWFCFAATYCSEFDMLFHNNQHAFMSRFHPCTRSCRIWLIFVGCKGYHNALVLGQGLAAILSKQRFLHMQVLTTSPVFRV